MVKEFNPTVDDCKACLRGEFNPTVDTGRGVCRWVGFPGHRGKCHWNGCNRVVAPALVESMEGVIPVGNLCVVAEMLSVR